MKINFKHLACSVVIIYILVMITLHRYPNMPDNKISFGDFANILVGLTAVSTLLFSIWDRHKTTIKHNSAIALESYVNSIDGLMNTLLDAEMDIDTIFFSIETCHTNLVLCQKSITEKEHKRFAVTKYETLRTHLKLKYHRLQIEDLLSVPEEVREQYNMTNFSTSWPACSYVLVSSWLKYVVPRTPFYKEIGTASYGNYMCTEETYIGSMLSLLIAQPLSLKPNSNLLNKFSQFIKTCEIEQSNSDLYDAFNKYPSLAAHLMLSKTCSVQRSKYGDYPNLSIAVHDVVQKKVWVSFKGGNFKHNHPIPAKLANSKYLKKR
ncbi:hypothetical protein LRP50_14055 [Enterovibrio sp. ZSDZ42]|uniref:Uncharacterized protein n=1 Tax=Enterovibrio gelatinilyticus TaxID=2899819 RepID=A0ABT5R3B6_9GAMM|nr:hypothetical protein [Enterovibrio sp. ZSDZ42]MDD1794261.1 hypothetical protein [Enterovibrio sp. ZSDZ42]